MTEERWLNSDDYPALLRFIHSRTTIRQARLCMSGCCRQWAGQFSDSRIPCIIEAAEYCADNADAERALNAHQQRWLLSREPRVPKSGRWCWLAQTIADAHQKLDECRVEGTWDGTRYRSSEAAMAHALYMALREDPLETFVGGEGDAVAYCTSLLDRTGVLHLRNTPGQSLFEIDQAKDRIRLVLANVLRDIFANPFRPAAFSPEWRTDTAVALAQRMYESRDFGAMPILADALQDAGCENEDILTHCRGGEPHVRGCWVADLVLGKE
ncbi:MAG TPA: hypothetical protein VGE74_29600 [Gemmata sp.]